MKNHANDRHAARNRPGIGLIAISLGLSVALGAQQLAESVATADGGSITVAPAGVLNPVSGPVQYTIGAGDVLHISVWQEAEFSGNAMVRPDGNISLPLINEVKVSGMTPVEVQDIIAQKLKRLVHEPKVTVTVTEIHSKQAFITGEVTRPGEYPLNTQITVLQLIAQAGGFTPFAKTDRIVVLRTVNGAQQRLGFKYKEVVKGVRTEQNITLQAGDTVVVP